VGIALALTQWTHRILPLAEMSRADRIRVLTWVVVGLLVLLLAADYGSRLMDWIRRRQSGSVAVSATTE
jgi:multisubunit Na+/H+ antiporter MnhB subunit